MSCFFFDVVEYLLVGQPLSKFALGRQIELGGRLGDVGAGSSSQLSLLRTELLVRLGVCHGRVLALVGHVQRVNRRDVGPYEAEPQLTACSVSRLPSVGMRMWWYMGSAIDIYSSR